MKIFVDKNLELIRLARSSSSNKSRDEIYVKELLQKGVDINYKDDIGSTALIESCGKGNRAFKILCDNGANVSIQDDDGLSALMLASAKQTKILLNLGANINAQTKDGNNALMFAIACEDIQKIRILVKNKININIQNKWGETPLIAIASKLLESLESKGIFTKIIKYFLTKGANKRVIDKKGNSALTYAYLIQDNYLINLLSF